MKKNVQRILATILTVIMMISMLPSNVFAADFDADMFVEPAVEAVSVPAEEQEVESTVEYIYEEPAETLQGSSDEIQTVEAADPAADEIEEETEAPVVDGTVTLKAEGSDYTVTVTYDVSAGLPADADIKVKEVMEKNKKYDDYVAQAADTIASDVESLNYVRLFDITLVDAAGNDLEPDNSVDVQIQLKDVVEVQDTTQVVHFAGEEEVPEVVETAVEGDTVYFTTDGFSVYAVVDDSTGGEARLEVTFDLNGGTIEGVEDNTIKVYVKADDITDNEFDKIVYNPGTPEATGKKFMGWTSDPNFDSETTPMDFDAVREDIKGILQATEEPVVHDLGTKTYYAMMFNEFELRYKNEGNVLFSAVGELTTKTSADITIEQEYTVTSQVGGFLGWVVEGTETQDNPTIYKVGDTIHITENTTLVPLIGNGFWLHYNGNDGGSTGVDSASYTKSVYIPENVYASEYVPVPPVPTRTGYDFDGWYTGEDNDELFDFDQPLTKDTTIYAHWSPAAQSSYTVIVWAQSVDDLKDAADDAKTYDYVKSQSFEAETGTQITEEMLAAAGFLGYGNSDFGVTDLRSNSSAFKYSRFKVVNGAGSGKDEVSALGDTIVNVYYDRELMTIQFRGASDGQQETWYELDNDGIITEAYGLIGGQYVKLTSSVANKRIEWSKVGGSLALPDNITQVKWSVKNNGTWLYSEQTVNVSTLRNKNAGDYLMDLPVGTNDDQAFTEGGNRYLYSTASVDGSYCRLKWTIAGDTVYKYNGETYTGPLYEKASGNVLRYTGLYGQQLSKYGYTWPDPDSTWWSISYLGSFTGNLFGDPTLDDDTGNHQGIANTIKTYKTNSTANTTLVFYVQDPDNTSTYTPVATAGYSIPDGDGYNITERFLGAEPVEYAWSDSSTTPTSGWVTASDGYTSARAGRYLHIRYDRVKNDIVFMLGSKAEKTIVGVPFGKSLSSYEAEAPDKPTTAENMYFAGWFEDPEGTKEVDWSGTMPLGNMVIYGVTKPISYHVIIEMNAGEGETVSLPAGQRTEFWLDYNETIDGANLMRATKVDSEGNPYSIIAYYTKNAVNGKFDVDDLWSFEGSQVTMDLLEVTYSGPDDPARVSYRDNGYDGVQGVMRLYASWRDDSLINNGIGIKYESSDGTNTAEAWDEYRYADQATVIVVSKEYATLCPVGKRFAGWKLSDTTYLPGQTFVTSKGAATLGDDNKYYMTLVAQYEDIEEKTPSHINWYWNDGREGDVEDQIYYTTEDVEINKAYDIPDAPTSTDENYAFLGWALADEKQSATDPNINTTYAGEVNFLKYDNGEYILIKNGAETKSKVTQIAADEVTPYHGLYAVWGNEYSIYHQSDESTETFVSLRGSDPVNLADKVKGNNLYGGYYHYENGTKGVPYAENGLALEPKNGTTYYLKEVPKQYLKSTLFITYDTNAGHTPQYGLSGLYLIMDIDETYEEYNDFGFIINGDYNDESTLISTTTADYACEELVLKDKDTGEKKEEYTLSSFFSGDFVEGDRLAVYEIKPLIQNDEFTLRAFFTTPDGVLVTGIKERTIKTGNLTFENQSWTSQNGINYTAGSDKEAYYESGHGEVGSKSIASGRTYQIKSTPDVLTYTVTKVDDGKNESQVVQAGNNTGKITYAGKTGYIFAGWYLDKAYTKAADFSAVTGDMTVYAKYVKASAMALSFTKKSSKSGSVTLKATLKITGAPDLADAAVSCDYKGKTSEVKFTGVKTTKSGKTTVSTYTGTVSISGLANKASFTAVISYNTPDGTNVTLADKTCKYTSGNVTVK